VTLTILNNKRYFLVRHRGRYTNQNLPIPIPYNPFILNKKEPQKSSQKPKIDWYGKAVEYQKMLSMGVAKNKKPPTTNRKISGIAPEKDYCLNSIHSNMFNLIMK
jgi:hypothetical protein